LQNYKFVTNKQIIELVNICKIIGNSRFLRTEYAFRKNYNHSIPRTIKFFKDEILYNEELSRLKYMRPHLFEQKVKHKIFFLNNKILDEEEYLKLRGKESSA
jgi:hypothetical protein